MTDPVLAVLDGVIRAQQTAMLRRFFIRRIATAAQIGMSYGESADGHPRWLRLLVRIVCLVDVAFACAWIGMLSALAVKETNRWWFSRLHAAAIALACVGFGWFLSHCSHAALQPEVLIVH